LDFGLTGKGGSGAETGVAGEVGAELRPGYPERHQDMLVYYARRRRRSEPISTASDESAVNEIVAKRMNKKQQKRYMGTTVQHFLNVPDAELNETLEMPSAIVIRASAPAMMTFCQRLRDLPQDFGCSLGDYAVPAPQARRL
jgi:hypothetical protein